MKAIRAGRGYPSGPLRVCGAMGWTMDRVGWPASWCVSWQAEASGGVRDIPAGLPGGRRGYVALAQGWELRPTDENKKVRLWWSAASRVDRVPPTCPAVWRLVKILG